MVNDRANLPVKVLHICSDDLWGGAEAQVFLLFEGLKSHLPGRVHSGILTFNNGELSKRIRDASLAEVLNVDESLGLLNLFKASLKLAKTFKPDIIVSHGYKENFVAVFLKTLLAAKWIHQIHGNSENYQGINSIKSSIYSSIETSLAKTFADKIICVSASTKETFKLESSKKCLVVYNSAKKLAESILKKTNDEKIRIFIIGRLAPIKRVDLAIDALKKSLANCPTAELHIVGDGPLQEELKQRAFNDQKYQSQILFHGFRKDSQKLLHEEGDLLLLTSDNEGIPTVILEAIHSKVPVIARRVGGIPEIQNKIPKYPLILTNKFSAEGVANVIEESIQQLSHLKSEALNCDTSFFEVERNAREHHEIYSTLVNN